MNKSEAIAQDWIIKRAGKEPIFQNRKSPDFLSGDESYEVKPGYKDKQGTVHVILSREQVERMIEEYPACKLLVVVDGTVSQLDIPPYLTHQQKLNERFIVHWSGQIIKVSDQTFAEIKTVTSLLKTEGLRRLPSEFLADDTSLSRDGVVHLGMRALQYLVGQNAK